MIRKNKDIVNATIIPKVCGYSEKCLIPADNPKLSYCLDKKKKACTCAVCSSFQLSLRQCLVMCILRSIYAST